MLEREREDSSDCLLFRTSGFLPSTGLCNNYHPRVRTTLYSNIYPNIKELSKNHLCTFCQSERDNLGSWARGGAGTSANRPAPTCLEEPIVKLALMDGRGIGHSSTDTGDIDKHREFGLHSALASLGFTLASLLFLLTPSALPLLIQAVTEPERKSDRRWAQWGRWQRVSFLGGVGKPGEPLKWEKGTVGEKTHSSSRRVKLWGDWGRNGENSEEWTAKMPVGEMMVACLGSREGPCTTLEASSGNMAAQGSNGAVGFWVFV